MRVLFLTCLLLAVMARPCRAQPVYVALGVDVNEIVQVAKHGGVRSFVHPPPNGLITALAVDGRGRVYAAYQDGSSSGPWIQQYGPDGSPGRHVSWGRAVIVALAADAVGNLYVVSYAGNQAVITLLGADDSRQELAAIKLDPVLRNGVLGIACDAAGNVYFTESGWDRISKITPDGLVSVLARGLPDPGGLAMDRNGILLVACRGGIYKVEANGVSKRWAVNPRAWRAFGVALDDRDDVFATIGDTDALWKVSPDGTMTEFAAGLTDALLVATAPPVRRHSPLLIAGIALGFFAFVAVTLVVVRRGWRRHQ